MDLDRIPLWRGDHVTLHQLWRDYCQYFYLPRLRDSTVLLDAVRSGIALLTWRTDAFAYASAYDEEAGRYVGLAAGQHAGVVLDTTLVIVKAQVAASQMDLEEAVKIEDSSTAEASGPESETGSRVLPLREAPRPAAPRHFYGRKTLDPLRMVRDIGDIAEVIVNQLGRADPSITITVEIEAIAGDGFPEEIRRSVDENARTLRFEVHEFEDG